MSFRTCFKIAACIGMIAVSQSAYAQLRDVYLYMQLGGGWGAANTLNAGGTLMYKRWAATVDFVRQRQQAYNVPPDYNPGLTFFGDGKPKQALDGACIEGARVIYFANGNLRFLARAGMFFGTYGAPEHYKKVQPGWFTFDSNYDVDFQTHEAIGLVFHPTLEWPGTVPFGVSTGIRIIVTEPKMTAAIDFNILIGKVRKSRRHEMREKAEQQSTRAENVRVGL